METKLVEIKCDNCGIQFPAVEYLAKSKNISGRFCTEECMVIWYDNVKMTPDDFYAMNKNPQ